MLTYEYSVKTYKTTLCGRVCKALTPPDEIDFKVFLGFLADNVGVFAA